MVVTQDFLTEFEVALLRAYNRAVKKGLSPWGADLAAAARSREEFVREFMAAFQEQRTALEREIGQGGHHPASVSDQVSREVESKLRASLTQNRLNRASFQKMVRDLKVNIRSAFYESYLSK